MVYFAGFASVFFTLSILWQEGLGHTALITGLVIAPFSVGSLISASQSDKLSARLGRMVLVTGCVLVITGLGFAILVVHLTAPAVSGWYLVAPLFVAGERAPHWRAGGIMLQMTPEVAKQGIETKSDDWDRLSLLLKTVEDLELVDTSLAPETLLWRLFHEDEVRVQPPEPVVFRCDCDADRITQVLKGYSAEERAGLADPDGIIRAKCEFCGKVHEIGPESLS